MTKILAIDLGKFKSVACMYQTTTAQHTFETLATRPQAIHDLLAEQMPDRVVMEIGSQAGWVSDLAQAAQGVQIQMANTNHEAWRWKNTKRKTDRDDALELAKLSAMDQLPLVTLPSRAVRQWRSFIAYRHTLIGRRTAIKNSIRSVLDREGMTMPQGASGWTQKSVAALGLLALPLDQVQGVDLWRGQLQVELAALEQMQTMIKQVEDQLEVLAGQDKRVRQLRTIPGVGPRLAEMVVATIDDPHRFKNGKQVGAYAGLAPRQYESGTMQRQGRITGQGNKQLRALLVEVGWLMRRYNGHYRGVFDRVCRGSKTRRKIAVVAVARRLLVCCWAMMRDRTDWREPNAVAAT